MRLPATSRVLASRTCPAARCWPPPPGARADSQHIRAYWWTKGTEVTFNSVPQLCAGETSSDHNSRRHRCSRLMRANATSTCASSSSISKGLGNTGMPTLHCSNSYAKLGHSSRLGQPFSKTYPRMARPYSAFSSCFFAASFTRGLRLVPELAAPQAFTLSEELPASFSRLMAAFRSRSRTRPHCSP
jgi:hypothetical protein